MTSQLDVTKRCGDPWFSICTVISLLSSLSLQALGWYLVSGHLLLHLLAMLTSGVFFSFFPQCNISCRWKYFSPKPVDHLSQNLFTFFYISVVSLSLCNTAMSYLEVKEGTDDNIFTCTGFTTSQTVSWWSNGNQLISQCPPLPYKCSNSSLTHFGANRTSGSASHLTVYARNITNSTYFGTTSLKCQASTAVTCQLDLVCKYLLFVK